MKCLITPRVRILPGHTPRPPHLTNYRIGHHKLLPNCHQLSPNVTASAFSKHQFSQTALSPPHGCATQSRLKKNTFPKTTTTSGEKISILLHFYTGKNHEQTRPASPSGLSKPEGTCCASPKGEKRQRVSSPSATSTAAEKQSIPFQVVTASQHAQRTADHLESQG